MVSGSGRAKNLLMLQRDFKRGFTVQKSYGGVTVKVHGTLTKKQARKLLDVESYR